MRTRLALEYRFEAAHFLPRVPDEHKCKRLHGHSYLVVVTVEGEPDPSMGWVQDFGDIDAAVAPVIASLDHRLLNDLEGLANPTSELLGAWLWARIQPELPLLVELTVSETPASRCIIRG
jgi:6-pyruvoyltetrahydropterin/6-carboxytetrahydropterin synthase